MTNPQDAATGRTLDPRSDLSGKVLPRRVPRHDRCTLVLVYRRSEALGLRNLAEGITLKGRKASLSTIARRALSLYAWAFARDPLGETAELEKLVTANPQASTVSKKGGVTVKASDASLATRL